MCRVARPGGVMATAMWDNTGGNDLNQSLWDAAVTLETKAPQPKDSPGAYGTAEKLTSLWGSAGITNIEVKNIVFPCEVSSLDDYWSPLTKGQGPDGDLSLSAFRRSSSCAARAAARESFLGIALMDHLRSTLKPGGTGGSTLIRKYPRQRSIHRQTPLEHLAPDTSLEICLRRRTFQSQADSGLPAQLIPVAFRRKTHFSLSLSA